MQNMMPQLNLSNRAIQTGQTAQSAGKTGKSSQKDRFRDLLQNSPGKNSLKEKASDKSTSEELVSKAGSAQKPEKQQQTGKTEKVKEKPVEGAKEDSTPAEETLLEAGVPMFQYMLDSNPITLRMVSSAGDSLEDVLVIPQISDSLISVSGKSSDEDQSLQIVSEAQLFSGQGEQEDAGSVTNAFVEMAAGTKTVSDAVSSENHVSKAAVRQGESDLSGAETPERSDHVQAAALQEEASAYQKSGQSSEDRKDEMGNGSLEYFAENILQQNSMQGQVQKTMGTQETVHIRAGSTQELVNQLVQQLRDKITLGNQEFEIQIHPENLGRLAIKVAYAAEKVSISIVCSNEKTMEILSAGAKNIAQIMEENLGTPITVVVDHQEENYLEQYKDQQNSQQQQKEKKDKEHASEDNQDFLQQLRLGLI